MTSEYERGTSPLRAEWIQETTRGEVPDNPEWEAFSDNITSVLDWAPDANTQRQDASGEIEAQGFYNGAETHEATMEYDLQRWFIDPSGNTLDPHGDFLRPSSTNAIRNTHTVFTRSEYETGGNDDAGYRAYRVGKGGYPSNSTIPFETEDGSPINVDPTWQFEKLRAYYISQPNSSTQLVVSSGDNSDTTQTLTIEDEGANTTEDVNLSGTNSQTTTASFSDIDAAELDSETAGSISITSVDTGSVLMFIRGQNDYPSGEGDLGVPALGTGSHASTIGDDYSRFLDDSIDVPNLRDDEHEIVSGDLTVDTGLSDNAQSGDTARLNIYPEEFSYVFTLSLAGEHVHVDQTVDYLTEDTGTLTWTETPNTSISATVQITSPGTYTKESNNGKLVADNEFSVVGGLNITNTNI